MLQIRAINPIAVLRTKKMHLRIRTTATTLRVISSLDANFLMSQNLHQTSYPSRTSPDLLQIGHSTTTQTTAFIKAPPWSTLQHCQLFHLEGLKDTNKNTTQATAFFKAPVWATPQSCQLFHLEGLKVTNNNKITTTQTAFIKALAWSILQPFQLFHTQGHQFRSNIIITTDSSLNLKDNNKWVQLTKSLKPLESPWTSSKLPRRSVKKKMISRPKPMRSLKRPNFTKKLKDSPKVKCFGTKARRCWMFCGVQIT